MYCFVDIAAYRTDDFFFFYIRMLHCSIPVYFSIILAYVINF